MMICSPHLQAMGIQQWVRRDLPQQEVLPEVAEATERVVDFSAQITLQGDVSAPLMLITTPLEQEAEQLLSAMLRAIGIDSRRCYRLTVEEPGLFSSPEFIVFLQQQITHSTALAQLQLGGVAVSSERLFRTAHPAHLLHHPEDKRAAWETLKQLHLQVTSP